MIDGITRDILEQKDNIENQRNREFNSNREALIKKQEKEIERLNNIIDELEKYLNEELENYTIEIENKNKGKLGYTLPIKGEIKNILDKLNKLKGDNK